MGGKASFAVIVGSIASVAAVTVSSAGPVGAQTAPETNVAPALDWKPCGRDFPGALCATAKVPLDYGDPQGPSTRSRWRRSRRRTNAASVARSSSTLAGPEAPASSSC